MVLSVDDRVKSRATLYDAGTEDEDGLTFSQRQLGKGLGAFCFRAVTHVYRKVGKQSQKYRVKWDDGTVSQVLHEHLELLSVGDPPILMPHTEEAHNKYREWSSENIDKFLRCIFGGAQYKVCALLTFVLGLSYLALYHPTR